MDPRASRALTAWLQRLFPSQRAWATESARFAVLNKTRQGGFSHATAAGACLGALSRARPQIILSASQDQSDEVLAKAKAHARVLAALDYPGAGNVSVDSATELGFAGGGRIIALPANPRTARGYAGDLWLDEFAYHADAEKIRDAAFPIAMRGDWKIRMLSTPNGASGLFYDTATAPPDRWVSHRVTIDDVIAEGLEVNLADLRALTGGDEALFNQWFRCAFLDGDLQYYPTQWLQRTLLWDGKLPSLDGATIHAGLDVGRKKDLSVLVVVAVVAGIAYVLAVLTMKRTRFAEQKRIIDYAREMFAWDTLHVDETGIGTQLAEELVDKYGAEEVKPVQFTAPAKEALFTGAFRWLGTNRLRFSLDQHGADLVAEGKTIRRIITKSGNVSYRAASTEDGHADRWTGLALALKGAGEPTPRRGLSATPLVSIAQ